jgi:hypothetical protein
LYHASRFNSSNNDYPVKKKPKATKCSDHHNTISLITQEAKSVARILRKRPEKKIEEVLGEHQFGFRKGTTDAATMLRIISE